ncbi:MAG: sodium:proton antiporter [Planctomycetes bacterium]|nr:sodium:proton antiporter [Planctomycetota bacterium]
MTVFQHLAILITITAVLSYVNHRFIKMPTAIGLMLLTMAGAVLLILLKAAGIDIESRVHPFVASIDFEAVLMDSMLGFLLFAGALHVNIDSLLDRKYTIGILATVGVVTSTLFIGGLVYGLSRVMDLEMAWIYCLLFGALISPTDPIAVLAILKKANASHGIETKLAGESLFNDGVAVILFIALLDIVKTSQGGGHAEGHGVGMLLWHFLKDAGGGVLLGLVSGYLVFLLLKSIDNYQVEVLLTVALVAGGYALAQQLHVSGPLAMVVAGLMIGNHGRQLAMSPQVVERLDTFWEMIDELLNALLFVLIGLEVLILTLNGRFLLAGVIAIPICLAVRFVCVAVPITLLRQKREFSPNSIKILTWAGLRGGIAVALALAIPADDHTPRELILTMTYVVVAFSIVVQGLTVKYLVKS